jgi:hypothetical protein
MNRRFAVATAVALSLLAPASAAAQDPQACAVGGGPYQYQARLTGLLDHADAAARERLGTQFAGLWLSDRRQGWAVGVAPGALDAEEARAAIVDGLATRVSGERFETLSSMLSVHPQPYGWAELEAVQAQLVARLEGLASAWSAGIGCPDGDAWRVEVWLFRDATPESIARAQEIVAPFAPRARLTVTAMGPPTPAAGPAPFAGSAPRPRLRRFVALPRRCVRGRAARIRVRRSARPLVERLAVSVAGERRRVGVAVRVHVGRRTRLAIALRLRDGRSTRRVITLRRCG